VSPAQITLIAAAALILAGIVTVALAARRRNIHRWLGGYLKHESERRSSRIDPDSPIHVLLCIADHFEPGWDGASIEKADARVESWVRDYPATHGAFRDSDGRPPRHTFFYPIDQYEPRHVDAIAGLCRAGFGEVEVHLHHDHDTAANLEATLNRFTTLFAEKHGLLGRWPDGRPAYGFIHGNWALDNSRPDGRWCGVNNELDILQRTGCFADFTLPSAPDATQTRKVNSIYYATGRPGCCKSHDRGVDVGAGPPPPGALMLIQGPLRPWWPRGSRTPKVENGCIQHSQPPSMARLDQWTRAGVSVRSRPDWVFVKLHTHGATEANTRVLLGEPMTRFHTDLARRAAADHRFRFHYVTAREMYNLAKAAEAGFDGPVLGAIDHLVRPSPSR